MLIKLSPQALMSLNADAEHFMLPYLSLLQFSGNRSRAIPFV